MCRREDQIGGPPYSVADRKFLIDAWESGLHVRREIAPALDRSYDSVRQCIRRMQKAGSLGPRYAGRAACVTEWENSDGDLRDQIGPREHAEG